MGGVCVCVCILKVMCLNPVSHVYNVLLSHCLTPLTAQNGRSRLVDADGNLHVAANQAMNIQPMTTIKKTFDKLITILTIL